MRSAPGHRVIPPHLPLGVLAVLFAFAGLITWLQGLPNPGYAQATGSVEVAVDGLPRSAKALQLRSRCGSRVVDNITLTSADFKMGEALRMLPTSADGTCFVEVKTLPAQDDFVGAQVGEGACEVSAAPLTVSCS